jgi:predicted nucleic acid-binding protein
VIVLDASALVDVLTDQPEKGWVLDEMGGHEILAPAHQPAEVLSAVSRLGRAGVISARAVAPVMAHAMELRQELVLPTRSHVRRALQLAGRIRVVDGLYVALAEERTCAFVTTDRRLARASTACEIRTPPPLRR